LSFTFIDLFAGIGGFHAALRSLGGECVWASEFDSKASDVYELNWGLRPAGDIVPLTDPVVSDEIPAHDILCGGFPCQPFSKSGKQKGFKDTTRGTLFFNICQIIEARKPSIVFLENVRNLAGPRQVDTWKTIIQELRNLGYLVSSTPTVFSPHLLPEELGGAPQVRERVFIIGIYVGAELAKTSIDVAPIVSNQPVDGFDPQKWEIDSFLIPDSKIKNIENFQLSANEITWINAWDDFVQSIRKVNGDQRLPGFPLWADSFKTRLPNRYKELPNWKIDFLIKNRDFYIQYKTEIDKWKLRWNQLEDFPPSRRKLEWQAQDNRSLWDCVMHFRPSGIRAKRATYLPALVAITQTSIIGSRRRRLTPNEAKLLQGLPKDFKFGNQADSSSYRQLGNGVSVGAASFVLAEAVKHHADLLRDRAPHVLNSISQHC
jgi:DNA (cytosine-5)-methyltransferase 1